MPTGFGHLNKALALITVSAVSLGYSANADDDWQGIAKSQLQERLNVVSNTKKAKNVILFMSDGLGVTAATISRIYQGQSAGKSGEQNYLAWERFPHSALIKTYSSNAQITDSAATASAIATGYKTNIGAVSTYDAVGPDDCRTMLEMGSPMSIAEKVAAMGKATGVVTTTRVTDATPASQYAHSPNRRWESDAGTPDEAEAVGCKGISTQLIESDIDVAMGGGRVIFYPAGRRDPENGDRKGLREDGQDLTVAWGETRDRSAYVESAEALRALDLTKTDSLLGLFADSSMVYEDESVDDGMSNPTLAEMAVAAIDVLSKDEDGYFLLVEHEGTDDLQHGGYAKRMAIAAGEMSEAVTAVLEKVDLSETLVVFTSDHSQAISFAGYIKRGNPVFGLARDTDGELLRDSKGMPFTTVGFYTGPDASEDSSGDLSEVDIEDEEYIQRSAVPYGSVTHSGEDVPLYAAGPWSHLFGGLLEQHTIHNIIMHAMKP